MINTVVVGGSNGIGLARVQYLVKKRAQKLMHSISENIAK